MTTQFAYMMGFVALELLGKPTTKSHREWRFGGRGSLSVDLSRGVWHDHEAGVGGGVLDLVTSRMHTDKAGAVAWLSERGHTNPQPNRPVSTKAIAAPKGTVPLARTIWSEGVAAAGTPVERYLAGRRLTVPPTAPLRFHPACARGSERLPAMIALMSDPVTAEPCGVHRTFLRPDGSGKADGNAKMMLGNAGVIRLVPDGEVTAGLGIAEGIETGLSILQVAGWSPVWAATCAGGISTFPVLPGIEALTVFADADEAGTKAAKACAERWVRDGREVTIHRPPEGRDWNDIARAA